MKHSYNRNEQIDNPVAWMKGDMYNPGVHFDNSLGQDASIIATTPSGASTSWADAFKTALPVLASVYQQREMTKLNLARIGRNQAPMTAQEFASVYQPPSAQVQFGATQDAKRLMLYAAIGLAALVGLRAAKVI